MYGLQRSNAAYLHQYVRRDFEKNLRLLAGGRRPSWTGICKDLLAQRTYYGDVSVSLAEQQKKIRTGTKNITRAVLYSTP